MTRSRGFAETNSTKRVAITGATGFIGAEVVRRHLARGDHVRVLTRRRKPLPSVPSNVQVVVGDLANPGAFLREFVADVDILYHCAGECRVSSAMAPLHINGTAALLAEARGEVRRWVQLSSVGVYGPRKDGVVTEDEAPNPVGVYEITKAASDRLVLDAWGAGDLHSMSILRPSIVFGPTMRAGFLRQLVRLVKRGAFFYIGDPGASANYIHVDAVVGALVRCGTDPRAHGGVYNISDWCTIEDFVGGIAEALGRKPPRARISESLARFAARALERVPGMPLTVQRVDALVGRARYSTQRIREDLGYEAEVPVRAGIRSFVRSEAWQ